MTFLTISRYSNCFFFANVIFLALLPGCKKENTDSVPPVITIISPSAGTTYDYEEGIPVHASVSDDKQLTSIRIDVTNATNQQFLQSISYLDVGVSKEVNTFIFNDDLYLESGNYFVRITASDGSNESVVYQEITLNEAPTLLQKIYVVKEYDANYFEIDSLTTSASTEVAGYFNGSYAVGGIDSRYKICVIGNQEQHVIQTYDANSFQTISGQATISSPADYARDIFYDEATHSFLIGGYDGKIWKVNNSGLVSTAFDTFSALNAEHLVATDNMVFVHLRHPLGTGQNMSVYNRSSGTLIQSMTFDDAFDVKGMFVLDDDHILVAGNAGGESLFQVYNNMTNFFNEVFTFYDHTEISGVWPGPPGRFYVGHADGIVTYDLDIQITSTGLPIQPAKLVYEKISGNVYAIEPSSIHILNTNATAELGSISGTSYLDVLLLYNK